MSSYSPTLLVTGPVFEPIHSGGEAKIKECNYFFKIFLLGTSVVLSKDLSSMACIQLLNIVTTAVHSEGGCSAIHYINNKRTCIWTITAHGCFEDAPYQSSIALRRQDILLVLITSCFCGKFKCNCFCPDLVSCCIAKPSS